jgi:hypothetical protein
MALKERTACQRRVLSMRNPNTLPSPKKEKQSADMDGRRKSEENSPTPAEPEVRRAGLEREGGGGGGECVLRMNRVSIFRKLLFEIKQE